MMLQDPQKPVIDSDRSIEAELGKDVVTDIEDAVMRGYIVAHSTGSETALEALERLLVTLLAATVVDRHLPKGNEGRAEELADVLIKAVKESRRNGVVAVPGLSKFVTIPLTAENSPAVSPSSAAVVTSATPRAWYVLSAGQQHGPWTDADFQENLHSGKLSATDKVWLAGLSDWIDLRSLPDQFAQERSRVIPDLQ